EAGALVVLTGDEGGGGLSLGNLLGEVRAGEHGDPVAFDLRDISDDLAHPHSGLVLDSLRQADDRRIRLNMFPPAAQVTAQRLGGDAEHDDLGTVKRGGG